VESIPNRPNTFAAEGEDGHIVATPHPIQQRRRDENQYKEPSTHTHTHTHGVERHDIEG